MVVYPKVVGHLVHDGHANLVTEFGQVPTDPTQGEAVEGYPIRQNRTSSP